MVPANIHDLLVSTYTDLSSFHILTSDSFFPWTLGGCDVCSSSSIANDLHRDMLPLMDSRITARCVMQDEEWWRQLMDRARAWRQGIVFYRGKCLLWFKVVSADGSLHPCKKIKIKMRG